MSIERRTLATYGLMGILVSYYGIMVVSGVDPVAPNRDILVEWGAYFPPKSDFSRIPSSILVFGHVLNLAFSLLGMFYIGRQVEVALGSARMLLVFFLSGLVGGLAAAYFNPAMIHAGAMPCVFGLLGTYWGYFFYNRKAYPPEHFRANLTRFFLTLLMFVVIDYTSNTSGMYEDYIVFGAGMMFPWLFGLQVDSLKSLRLRDALAMVVVLALIGTGGHYTRDFLGVSPVAQQARKGDAFNHYLHQVIPIFDATSAFDKEFLSFMQGQQAPSSDVVAFIDEHSPKWEAVRVQIGNVQTSDDELAAIQAYLLKYAELDRKGVAVLRQANADKDLAGIQKFYELRAESIKNYNLTNAGLKAFRTKYKF